MCTHMTELNIIMIILSIISLMALAAMLTHSHYTNANSRYGLLRSIDEYQKARDAIASYQKVHNELALSIAQIDQRVEDLSNKVNAVQFTQMRK